MPQNQMCFSALTVERISLSQLKIPKKTLRIFSKNNKRLAARQIEEFGFLIPLLVDENNLVLGGLVYFFGAELLELPDVPAIRVTHLSEEQKRAYAIAEQRLSELSPWDDKVLAEEFSFLSNLDLSIDLEITGFSCAEIDQRIANLDAMQPPSDPEDEPSAPTQQAVSQVGDLWHLGKHRLICGTCLEPETWTRLMGNEKAALVFTDPPYNVKISGHVSGNGALTHREFEMAAGEMTASEYRCFLLSALGHAIQHASNGALLYVCIDWRHIDDVLVVGSELKSKLINICCWVKSNGGMGSFYRSRHELIPVFRNGSKPHRNNIELGRHGRHRTNVWEYSGANTFAGRLSEEGNTLAMHPTVKPVAMIADAILDSTARNEIVVDPFFGSGATLMAAERTGRHCRGIELDPLYVDIAIRRWQRLTGGDAVLDSNGKVFSEIRMKVADINE